MTPEPAWVVAEEAEPLSDGPRRTVRALFEHPLVDVTWSRYEPGERGPDPHVHRTHVDAFYVVEGELEFGLGPDVETVQAPAGTFVLVPPLVVHTFGNEAGATARWLNFHAPGSGFIAHLRGETESWDSEDAPADGGRPAAEATVAAPGGGEAFVRSNRTLTVLGDDARLSAVEIAWDETFEVDAHRHEEEVDSFFVLAGEVAFTVGDDVVHAGPGTWLSAAPGARHGFRTAGPGTARALNLHAPDAGFVDGIRSYRP